MEHDPDIFPKAKTKDKSERRRSSIFSLLRKKKLTRQLSEPGNGSYFSLNRKFSVDSAILPDFSKVENGAGYRMCLQKAESRDIFVSNEGLFSFLVISLLQRIFFRLVF